MEKIIKVEIIGKTPLLVNRFHEDAAQEATSGVHSRKEKPTEYEDAKMRLYLNERGPYIPDEWIRQAMIGAAARHKVGRRAATTDVAAALYVFPAQINLQGDWHVDSRAIVIPATKGRLLRHRPMFDQWSASFSLQIDTDIISEALAKAILVDAGRLVGIGDFRPARKGPYGRFEVSGWETE